MLKRSNHEAGHLSPYRFSVGFKNAWNFTRAGTSHVHICEAFLGSRGTLLLPVTNYTRILIPSRVGYFTIPRLRYLVDEVRQTLNNCNFIV
jgi:hypothetical protein